MKILLIITVLLGCFLGATLVQAGPCDGLTHENFAQCQCNYAHDSAWCDGRTTCNPGMLPNGQGGCVNPSNTTQCQQITPNSTYSNGQCVIPGVLPNNAQKQFNFDDASQKARACQQLYGNPCIQGKWIFIKGHCAILVG